MLLNNLVAKTTVSLDTVVFCASSSRENHNVRSIINLYSFILRKALHKIKLDNNKKWK